MITTCIVQKDRSENVIQGKSYYDFSEDSDDSDTKDTYCDRDNGNEGTYSRSKGVESQC